MASNIGPPGFLPEIGYVRQSQLIPAIFPFSSATLWRKVKAGTFPSPIKLGARITALEGRGHSRLDPRRRRSQRRCMTAKFIAIELKHHGET
jgi:prophage regulatory protein